ncbi:MAG: peptide-methionine (S)-S-oxide reductase MsrA [Dehalococcoidia bacterium]|nr:peptide-methionine (S)-S-oxide reductase MsrA [Dehalococcoidia bacterium]MDD5495319.1 peptide-methionine (S)-S-oxide reductase MsrA [Dehalococcoidia bacterium]
MESAVFGGGCFWCTEAIFAGLKGVSKVTPGYAGGATADPTYQQVCGGATGHAEVIKIDYDPSLISYDALLDVFFHTHDPTTPDRQGYDVGEQYRSIIFYTSREQKEAAEQYIDDLGISGEFGRPIVTQVKPLTAFYEAEGYHQNYYAANDAQPYCRMVIAPKLAKLRAKYGDLLKPA